MSAVFLVSGFSLSTGFDAQGVLFLVLGVVALACLDFSVRVFGKNERSGNHDCSNVECLDFGNRF